MCLGEREMDEDLRNMFEELREKLEKDKKYLEGSLEIESEPVFIKEGLKRVYNHTVVTILFRYSEEKLV